MSYEDAMDYLKDQANNAEDDAMFDYSLVATVNDQATVISRLSTERDTLTAHCERLREVLGKVTAEFRWLPSMARACIGYTNVAVLERRIAECDAALAATPAQSLAAIQAGALEDKQKG